MLNLNKLEVFLMVLEAGSFSRAAERLLMTQSGVSQHIRDLEAALGTTLFERNRRGVAPTSAGEKLGDYATRIFELVAEAERAVTNVEQLAAGQIDLGATPGVGVYVLSPAIQAFRVRYPRLTVSLQTRITGEILHALRQEQLELGFVEGELEPAMEQNQDPEFGVRLLEPISQFVVVGREHPFWGRAELQLSELNRHSFVMRQSASQTRKWLDGLLVAHRVTPRVVAEFDTVEAIKRAVISGAGVAVLPRYAVADEIGYGLLQAIPTVDVALLRSLKVVWRRRRAISPVTYALLRHLSPRFPELENMVK